MYKHRLKARTDSNQNEIIEKLRQIPGVTVELSHDDFLVGFRGKTYWFELKNQDCVSKKTGKILETKIKEDQKRIRGTFTGHYRIVSSFDEILKEIGL